MNVSLKDDVTSDMPSYWEFFNHTQLALREFVWQFDKYPVKWHFWLDSFKFALKNYDELLLILFIAAALTIVRHISTVLVVRPLCKRLKLLRGPSEKMPEALWRFLTYSFLWAVSVYYVFFSDEVDYYKYPCRMFQFLSFGPDYFEVPMPAMVTFIYRMQVAFYIHSTFATLFMDYVRSDFKAMMLHHGVASCLLLVSYYTRYYKAGILTLYMHDATDILMEFAKLNTYLKYRGGKVYNLHEYLGNLFFLLFFLSWIYFRLYLYPLKLLHSSTWCAYLYHKDKDPRGFNVFNSMLFTLQGIHVYWFFLISKILLKIATGRMKEIGDIREEEVNGQALLTNKAMKQKKT